MNLDWLFLAAHTTVASSDLFKQHETRNLKCKYEKTVSVYINKLRNAIANLSNEDEEQTYGHNNELKPANKDVSNT
jgi:DNA-binding response OmpR family regulator